MAGFPAAAVSWGSHSPELPAPVEMLRPTAEVAHNPWDPGSAGALEAAGVTSPLDSSQMRRLSQGCKEDELGNNPCPPLAPLAEPHYLVKPSGHTLARACYQTASFLGQVRRKRTLPPNTPPPAPKSACFSTPRFVRVIHKLCGQDPLHLCPKASSIFCDRVRNRPRGAEASWFHTLKTQPSLRLP